MWDIVFQWSRDLRLSNDPKNIIVIKIELGDLKTLI